MAHSGWKSAVLAAARGHTGAMRSHGGAFCFRGGIDYTVAGVGAFYEGETGISVQREKHRRMAQGVLGRVVIFVTCVAMTVACGAVAGMDRDREAIATLAPTAVALDAAAVLPATAQIAVAAPTVEMQTTPTPTETVTGTPTATTTPTITPTETPTPTPTYSTHVVESRETLGGIAVRYGVRVDEIVAINQGIDPNLLQVGQALNIPARPEPLTPIAVPERDYGYAIVGYSVQGRAIEVFSFGDGPQQVLFVGGIHGGYEWNTVLLAYEIIDYFNGNRDAIPPGVTVNIIPVANPDGLYWVTGSGGRFLREYVAAETTQGRFNANNVDLNRNFGCEWSPTARWGGRSVFPGNGPFSEPETQALRNYFEASAPRAVVFWHSAAGGLVAPGTCNGQDAGSGQVAQVYAAAASYTAGAFTAYELSGTASDWLASQGIPAFAVELITHENTEYGRNLAGVEAVLALYALEPETGE